MGFWTEDCTLSSIVPISICRSSSFHEIGSLGFSKNLHSVRWPYLDVRNIGELLGKKIAPKMGKMGQKFGFFEFIETFGH